LNNELVHDAEKEEKLEKFKFWKRRKPQQQ